MSQPEMPIFRERTPREVLQRCCNPHKSAAVSILGWRVEISNQHRVAKHTQSLTDWTGM